MLGKSKLSPSYTRKPTFKSHESNEKHFEFGCIHCGEQIAVEYNLLINRVFGWEQHLGEGLASEAKALYGIGMSGKSPDGGWPSIVKVQCPKCLTEHLIYAGVDEASNSVYVVTLQGITEIIGESFGNEVIS
jgi:hypothetical protein